MKNLIPLFLIIILLTVGCQPSQSAISTAIAQTQAANPTLTFSPEPTKTFTPTLTPTLTSSPSPTPDLRIIKVEPKEFLLSEKDLPPEGKYYFPASDWTTPNHNSEIIQSMGAEKGNAYINETGRIDGWYAEYLRRAKNLLLPQNIYNHSIMFQSASGVKAFMDKYSGPNSESEFVELDSALRIGDMSRTFIRKKNGETDYVIVFSYKNYAQRIGVFGTDAEVNPKLVEDLANSQLKKLMDTPLSAP